MKIVNSPEQVAHLWAHQTQTEARNSNRSFFFYKDTIFSYGHHFPIARHVTNSKGEKAILFTDASYSISTAKHIGKVRNAIPFEANIINVPFVNEYQNLQQSDNIKIWKRNIENILASLQKAKKPEIYLNQIAKIQGKIEKYNSFFDLTIDPELELLLSIQNKDQYTELKEKQLQLQQEIEAKKLKEAIKKSKKHIEKFRSFEPYDSYNISTGLSYLRYNTDTNRIETSQRVEVPIEAAKRLYNNLKEGENILDFRVKSIDKNHITIGCHKIELKEVKRIAKQLNW